MLTMLRQKAIQNMHSTSTDAHREKCQPCTYVSWTHPFLKFKFEKIIKKMIKLKKENQRKAQKRKAGQEENNFALISKLLSDGEIPVKKLKVNVVKSSIFKRDTSLLAKLIELVHY